MFDFYELLVECDRKSNPYHHPRGDRDNEIMFNTYGTERVSTNLHYLHTRKVAKK